MNFVCRLSPLLGLRPSSSGAGVVASVRVALSRAARIPPLTLVRRSVLGVTKLLRGETSRDDARVAPDSRLGDRARVAGLGFFSRPESDAIGLVGGPTPTASVACGNATSAQAWPSCAPTVPAPTQLRVLSQNTRLSAKFKISLSRESFLGRTQFNACGPQTTVFHFNVSDERSSEEICKYFTDVLLSAEF